jgi:predicted nucleotidyltransferase
MVHIEAKYPTPHHERASQAVVDFFRGQPDIEAVILYGSCARGKGSPDSCLDFMVLVKPKILSAKRHALEDEWNTHYEHEEVFRNVRAVGKYSHVDLDFVDGQFKPQPRHWTSGPDEFELEIGNTLVYSVPLLEQSDFFQELKALWLPYYDEDLRQERIAMVKRYCVNNLDHIPLFVNRGLYFQAFNRLYDAFREFLQALFISRRIYPVAYDKWIKEQLVDILGMPDLYRELVNILEIHSFESLEIASKAEILSQLLENHICG